MAAADLFDIASSRADNPERKITALRYQVQSLEDIVPRLSLILNILETRSNRSPQNCSYLDYIAKEPRKCVVADKNGLVFNAPERLPYAFQLHATCPIINVFYQIGGKTAMLRWTFALPIPH